MSIFVDTGAWFASVIPSDRYHHKLLSFLHHNSLPLVTTDYVIDETLTLLRARGEGMKAIALGHQLLNLQMGNVMHITPQIFSNAWDVFRQNSARKWSFTDCTSKVVMEQRHIKYALALDRHFVEFGATNALNE